MSKTFFDIETSSLDDKFLSMIEPEFTAPSNFRDPEKIAANIAEQKVKWKEKAALDATTGKVLCIGIIDEDDNFKCMDGGGDEKTLLQHWYEFVQTHKDSLMIGYSSNSFDIPFLVRRAVFHGVKPCVSWSWSPFKTDKWVDLRQCWQLGDKQYSMNGLNGLSKFLGVGSKSGSGADFARLWAEDKPAALAYLQNDLNITKACAERMGF